MGGCCFVFVSFSFLSSFLSFGGESGQKWDLEVEGSAYGGRGFGPCSYPRGGLEIN